MKKDKGKLRLKRESLRTLTDEMAQQVAGGASNACLGACKSLP